MGDILESNVSNVTGITLSDRGRREKMIGRIDARNSLLKNLRQYSKFRYLGLGSVGCHFKSSISLLGTVRVLEVSRSSCSLQRSACLLWLKPLAW